MFKINTLSKLSKHTISYHFLDANNLIYLTEESSELFITKISYDEENSRYSCEGAASVLYSDDDLIEAFVARGSYVYALVGTTKRSIVALEINDGVASVIKRKPFETDDLASFYSFNLSEDGDSLLLSSDQGRIFIQPTLGSGQTIEIVAKSKGDIAAVAAKGDSIVAVSSSGQLLAGFIGAQVINKTYNLGDGFSLRSVAQNYGYTPSFGANGLIAFPYLQPIMGMRIISPMDNGASYLELMSNETMSESVLATQFSPNGAYLAIIKENSVTITVQKESLLQDKTHLLSGCRLDEVYKVQFIPGNKLAVLGHVNDAVRLLIIDDVCSSDPFAGVAAIPHLQLAKLNTEEVQEDIFEVEGPSDGLICASFMPATTETHLCRNQFGDLLIEETDTATVLKPNYSKGSSPSVLVEADVVCGTISASCFAFISKVDSDYKLTVRPASYASKASWSIPVPETNLIALTDDYVAVLCDSGAVYLYGTGGLPLGQFSFPSYPLTALAQDHYIYYVYQIPMTSDYVQRIMIFDLYELNLVGDYPLCQDNKEIAWLGVSNERIIATKDTDNIVRFMMYKSGVWFKHATPIPGFIKSFTSKKINAIHEDKLTSLPFNLGIEDNDIVGARFRILASPVQENINEFACVILQNMKGGATNNEYDLYFDALKLVPNHASAQKSSSLLQNKSQSLLRRHNEIVTRIIERENLVNARKAASSAPPQQNMDEIKVLLQEVVAPLKKEIERLNKELVDEKQAYSSLKTTVEQLQRKNLRVDFADSVKYTDSPERPRTRPTLEPKVVNKPSDNDSIESESSSELDEFTEEGDLKRRKSDPFAGSILKSPVKKVVAKKATTIADMFANKSN